MTGSHANETRRFPSGDLITQQEARSSGTNWGLVRLYTEHVHVAAAERDDDGMWEAACEGCGLLAGPVFQAVLPRFNTEAEATEAAAAIISMAEHGPAE